MTFIINRMLEVEAPPGVFWRVFFADSQPSPPPVHTSQICISNRISWTTHGGIYVGKLGDIYITPPTNKQKDPEENVLLFKFPSGRRNFTSFFVCFSGCRICFGPETSPKLGVGTGWKSIPTKALEMSPCPEAFPPPGPHLFHEVPERPVSSSEWPSWDQKTRPVFFENMEKFWLFPHNPCVSAGDFIPSKTPCGKSGVFSSRQHTNAMEDTVPLLSGRKKPCMYVCIYIPVIIPVRRWSQWGCAWTHLWCYGDDDVPCTWTHLWCYGDDESKQPCVGAALLEDTTRPNTKEFNFSLLQHCTESLA